MSLFRCSRPKDKQVMGVCILYITSKQFYAINLRSQTSPLYAVKKGDKRIYPAIDSLLMANTMVQISTLYVIPFVSYNRFSKHL